MQILKISTLALGTFLLANSALAQSTTSIEALLAQIKALQAQVATMQSTGTPQADDYGTGAQGACPKLSVTMERGARDVSTSGQVSELQKFLADHYDLDPLELVTGYFGRITQGYVQRFQKEQGLPSFGIVGSMTRAVIAKICGGSGISKPNDATNTTTVVDQTPATTKDTTDQVKCVFIGASGEQKCWGYVSPKTVGEPTRYDCSGVSACVITASGQRGTPMTLGSSCGGSADTIIDGNNEYANFSCSGTTVPSASITVINPNGGGYWYRGESALVEWKTMGVPSDSQMLIRLRSYIGDGTDGQEYDLVTSTNDGYEKLIVPTMIPLGAYTLEIKTAVGNQSYLDASGSYFKVTDQSTTTPTPTNTNSLSSVTTLPAGCLSGYLFSSLTGQRCVSTQPTYPPGCSSIVGYSSTTGKKCDGTTLTPISTISCGNGDDYYDGGEGTDTLTYSGKRSDFVITKNANGSYTFKDTVPCRADTDTVINMELFRFADGLYTLQDLFSVTGTNVQTNSVVINSFTASPATITPGQAVIFTWNSNLTQTDTSYYGGGCSIEGLTQNNVAALQVTPGFVSGGTATYVPPATATYTLRCSSGAKDGSPSATKQITVNVVQPPQTNPVVISSFTPSQTSLTSGQPVTFTWNSNLTNNDTSYYGGGCGISAITSYNQQIHITSGATSGASGSVTYTPSLTSTYTLTCSAGGKDGSPMATKQVTVSVQ